MARNLLSPTLLHFAEERETKTTVHGSQQHDPTQPAKNFGLHHRISLFPEFICSRNSERIDSKL
jgi:hypothetical protein